MSEHGTYACYSAGCRRSECREANSAYERARTRRVAPAYVGASRARGHVTWLREQGVGLKSIARSSGVSHGALSKLMYGDKARGRGPSKRIRKQTEDRILAVTPGNVADGARVPGDQFRADVRELKSRGWAYSAIARALGITPQNLRPDATSVTAARARAVHALLSEPVPEPLTRTGLGATAAKLYDEWRPEVQDPRERARKDAEAERRARYRNPDPAPTIDPDVFSAPWRKRSACRLLPPDERWIFWPGRGDWRTVKAAKDVCATCPVASDCLAFALEHGELGVWGGTTEIQRRRLRKLAS